MTETGGGVVICGNHEPREVGTNCFGRPGAESEVRVVADDGRDAVPDQPGELLVRRAGADPRHGFFREYLKDPEATAEAWTDGWFHTGDIVRAMPTGYLYFVDRKKNVIRRSGENIAAVEVESVLLQHPGVAAVGVAPVADDVRGEEVFAAIVLRDPSMASPATATEIVAHCSARFAYYKAPGYIAFVPSLPLTSTQKIQRGTLKTMAVELYRVAGDTRYACPQEADSVSDGCDQNSSAHDLRRRRRRCAGHGALSALFDQSRALVDRPGAASGGQGCQDPALRHRRPSGVELYAGARQRPSA